jgi:hypothetical protein
MEADMTATMSGPAQKAVPPARVRKIAVPADIRALTTLSRIDYADSFVIDFDPQPGRTAEQWARAVVEATPLSIRARLVCGWTALGIRLGPPWSPRRVLGWEVRRSNPDFALLGAGSLLGLAGELVFRREPDGLLFATLVQQNNRLVRALWAAVEPTHCDVVRSLLEHAARRDAP